jgi:uncharacterized caspase-like protein
MPNDRDTPGFKDVGAPDDAELRTPLQAGVSRSDEPIDPSKWFQRSLAVVIGIDKYSGDIPPLRSAVADATEVASALARDHGFEIWLLLDHDARLDNLRVMLNERLPSTLGSEDRLLFYFAGHGITLKSDGAPMDGRVPIGNLVPVDASRSDPASFLPMRDVHEALDRLPIRHALVILDCCYAGVYRQAAVRFPVPMVTEGGKERYHRFLSSAAWQLLTAASSDQRAVDVDVLAPDRNERGNTHSPFASALLEGLRGGVADYNRDKLITATELAMFVRDRVEDAPGPSAVFQSPQLSPLCRHDRGEFLFRVR